MLGLISPLAPAFASPQTWRVSVGADRQQANAHSWSYSISSRGRFVVFYSEADNLIEDDANRFDDIFLHERATQATEIISIGSSGQQGNNDSAGGGNITPDGRYVAFSTLAWNFDERDYEEPTNADVFVRDRVLAITTLVSLSSDGTKGNGQSGDPSISADGRYVVFHSSSNNLVEGDTNRRRDVFIHDRDADQDGVFDEPGGISTIRMTVGHDGEESDGNSENARITPDGRIVVFDSLATNLVPFDTNRVEEVFVHDRDLDEDGVFDEPSAVLTYRVSIDSDGREGDADSGSSAISADGRYVVFSSAAENLTCCDFNELRDVFLRDRERGRTVLVSMGINGRSGNASSGSPAISANGAYVVFASGAGDLVPDDRNGVADVFVFDVATHETERAVMGIGGEEPNGESHDPAADGLGCFVTFSSRATNLVEGDTNEAQDVFVVQLCIPGDFDGDERVDHGDFVTLEACLTGPGVRPAESCRKPDLDVDLDVDLYDFTILQSNYTGP
jgi:Tol biopolymer transport system component